MYTPAKVAFAVNLQRASFFLDIHEQTQPGVGAPVNARRELPRGALVFAVGALDAYLSELSAFVILEQLKSASAPQELRDVLRRVQTDVPTLALEVAVLPGQAEREARIREAITDHFLNNVSNHGSKAVASAVQRCKKKPGDFWSVLGTRGYASAADDLDKWTKARHQIVHEGKKVSVTRNEARDFIKLAMAIVEVLDSYATSLQ